MRILDESTYYWVWSVHGPSDTGLYYGRSFVDGMIPCPLPGDIAQEMECRGFCIEPYVPGTWFSHWIPDPGSTFRQQPAFEQITKNSATFPPAVPPDRIAPEWVEFFSLYTAGGRLKREHRYTDPPAVQPEADLGC